MPTIYLLRHGEPDYEPIRARNWAGAATDLASLTTRGIEQAIETGRELRHVAAQRIVSSPMTRALHTAALVATETRVPLSVEFDLREWLPDETFSWRTREDVVAAGADFDRCEGEWPAGQVRQWEPLSVVRERATTALRRHTDALPLIAVCHQVVIQALTGHKDTRLGGIRTLNI